jgi:Ferritin-like domain
MSRFIISSPFYLALGGLTYEKSFVTLSSVLKGVGTSAYLGAVALIENKDHLTAAGSVLTIEARHPSYIRSSLAQSPFPQAFDDPLSVNQVYTLASPFIKSCPSTNPPLPVTAFPALALATPEPIKANSTIVLHTSGYVLADPSALNSTQLYGALITINGPVFVDATPVTGGYSLVVPGAVNGQSYIVLTACHERVTDSTTAAGPTLVEISN